MEGRQEGREKKVRSYDIVALVCSGIMNTEVAEMDSASVAIGENLMIINNTITGTSNRNTEKINGECG